MGRGHGISLRFLERRIINIEGMKRDRKKKISKDQKDEIRLTGTTMRDYGYTRFCYPEEMEKIIRNGYRTISLGKNPGGSMESRKIFISQQYLIPLSRLKSEKLVHRSNFDIEEVGDRFDHLKILSKRAGWNQTERDLDELMRLARHSYYLASTHADDHSIPLGSGALVNLGDRISWISMILVHEEVRRQGIAASLLYRCILNARVEKKNRIVGLDATPEGKKLYIQMGFEKSFSILRCSVPTHPYDTEKTEISPESLDHFESIRDYLHQRGFEERETLFRSLMKLSEGGCFFFLENKQVTGFVMSRPGALKPYAGPLIADDEKTAKRLLAKVLEYWNQQDIEQILMDVPAVRLNIKPSGNSKVDPEFEIPFPIKEGFLRGSLVLRTFDRMYQLISSENHSAVLDFLADNITRKDEIVSLLAESEKNFTRTKAYLEKERNEMSRYQYAIGGPEFS
jgi:GNAT superfamily N-acetyltransferase